VEAELFHAAKGTDKQTGMTKLIVALRNSANPLNKLFAKFETRDETQSKSEENTEENAERTLRYRRWRDILFGWRWQLLERYTQKMWVRCTQCLILALDK